jgi:four helix bundle protein
MRDHRKLEVFGLADQLVVDVYEHTREFPAEELYGLVSQMRRCAVSAAANIVEGCGRRTEAEFDRYLDISFGSLRELGYFIDLSYRLGFLADHSKSVLMEAQRRASGAMASFITKRFEFRE